MMSVAELERSVSELTPEELRRFSQWFEEYIAEKEADAWDAQIADDFAAGRLNFLIQEANREFEAGNCKPL